VCNGHTHTHTHGRMLCCSHYFLKLCTGVKLCVCVCKAPAVIGLTHTHTRRAVGLLECQSCSTAFTHAALILQRSRALHTHKHTHYPAFTSDLFAIESSLKCNVIYSTHLTSMLFVCVYSIKDLYC